MNISNELKQKFIERDGIKIVKMYFPSLNYWITNEQIYEDTLNITEGVLSGSSIEFVGCISSTMSVEIHGVTKKLKGQKVIVYMTMQGFEDELIPVFNGYVDSVKTRLADSWKSITCYDALYYKASDVDIASWYNGLRFPMTIKQFRDGLFNRLGIEQETATLPNDGIAIVKQYIPSQMNALDTIKNICQANGVFGIIGRSGKFEYKNLQYSEESTNPSTYTFPALALYPAGVAKFSRVASGSVQTVAFYENMEFEDYDVYPINKVLVRDSEDDIGTYYGSGDNVYIIQGNMFSFGLDSATKSNFARNIFNNVSGFNYKPFKSDSVGLPFVECGTAVRYYIADYTEGDGEYKQETFYILNRTMKGIQELVDSYSAEGEQYQKIFLSDIGAKLDSIQRKVDAAVTRADVETMIDDTVTEVVDEKFKSDVEPVIEEKLSEMETPTGFTVVSCYTLPSSRRADTIYLVQSDLVVVK